MRKRDIEEETVSKEGRRRESVRGDGGASH